MKNLYLDILRLVQSNYLNQYRTDPYFAKCVDTLVSSDPYHRTIATIDLLSTLCSTIQSLSETVAELEKRPDSPQKVLIHLMPFNEELLTAIGKHTDVLQHAVRSDSKSDDLDNLHMKQETSDPIDEYNMYHFENCRDSEAPVLICRVCGNRVSKDDSYSDAGHNLHCSMCTRNLSRIHDMSVTEYCRRFIWSSVLEEEK